MHCTIHFFVRTLKSSLSQDVVTLDKGHCFKRPWLPSRSQRVGCNSSTRTMKAVEDFYAEIRGRRQLIPPLQGAPARESTDEEDVLAAIDAFDAEYGRDIKLPSEVL